jgi:large subunit ribosomal protein L23
MSEEKYLKVLLSPHISEKTNNVGEWHKQIVFKVLKDANKAEIKTAVEKLFTVSVKEVKVVNVKPKIKRFGKTLGKRKAWKKAYVSLHEGHDINFADKLAE